MLILNYVRRGANWTVNVYWGYVILVSRCPWYLIHVLLRIGSLPMMAERKIRVIVVFELCVRKIISIAPTSCPRGRVRNPQYFTRNVRIMLIWNGTKEEQSVLLWDTPPYEGSFEPRTSPSFEPIVVYTRPFGGSTASDGAHKCMHDGIGDDDVHHSH